MDASAGAPKEADNTAFREASDGFDLMDQVRLHETSNYVTFIITTGDVFVFSHAIFHGRNALSV